MNLQQLEYIVAVERERHFVRAAKKCFVAQATLSMMIKKLEEELGVKIFDRGKQPVSPTKDGTEIISRAKKILADAAMLKSFAKSLKGEITGEVRLAIIPTLAPYLLPLFLKSFAEKFPHLNINIRELVTDDIIQYLKNGDADIGILATPLNDNTLLEHPMFYEEFFAYAAKNEKLPLKKYILPKHINPNHLWLLQEGHCMRSQLMNYCSLKKLDEENAAIHYEAGSIETLIQLVDKNEGITILPQLATQRLNSSQKNKLREFAPPKPVREISLVTSKNFPRKKLLQHLREEIILAVRENVFTENKGLKVVELDL
ncbi:MAG TPA: LysR substrate-binding domain-containing protein [Chitinophagaceae bacterium]|nr:LysR substrate-binding domain-containing protein [Chitinophagaceae bacterium]